MRASHHGSRSTESGQALVEAALTLPLTVFLILGTLQLFLMLQARIVSEYAVFRATRAGSVSQGKCERMRHAAVLALLPTFTRTTSAAELAKAFGARRDNRYDPGQDSGHNRSIVWIDRESPTARDIQAAANRSPGNADDASFDDPDRTPQRLDVRLIYWYPMRIPFANWVMSHMLLAHYRVEAWKGGDATMVFRKNGSAWNDDPGSFMRADLKQELALRVKLKQYAFPIQATYSMRMMTPARAANFTSNAWCM